VNAPRALRALLGGAAACGGMLLPACKDSAGPTAAATPLRTLAALRDIRIGAATGSSFQRTDGVGTSLRTILAREFDMVWSGNFLKFSVLRPGPGIYDFTWADSMVAFAQAHGMAVRGHTFVWHNQLPGWLTGGAWSPTQVDSILADHITTVMLRYKGRIGIWDVVNEAVDDNALPRVTYWSTHLGAGYIERAFRLARAADSTALLFYNDYNIEGTNAKADSVYAMLADLKGRGVPIDGIGMQAHFQVGRLPAVADLVSNFTRFAQLGLKVEITELDIRMTLPATSQILAQQAFDYATIFNACLLTPGCDAVELGGVYDGNWSSPNGSSEGAALLFDESFNPKPAYTAVNTLLAGLR
jgi:endo-1,4-beta-xylanase